MTKFVTKTIGAAVAAAALVAAASPADAQRYSRYRHHHNNSGAVIGAGIIGLGIGAAIASGNNGYYGSGYYDPYYGAPYGGGYYDGYYGGGGGYYGYRPHRRHCVTRRVWDPYYRRYVRARYC